VAVGMGDFDRAIELLNEARELSGVEQAPREAASAGVALSWILLQRGELARARELLVEAREIFGMLQDRGKLAAMLECAAGLAVVSGQAEHGARLLGAAAALRESIGAVRQPDEDKWVEHTAAEAAAALGADAYAAARDAGRELDADAAARLVDALV